MKIDYSGANRFLYSLIFYIFVIGIVDYFFLNKEFDISQIIFAILLIIIFWLFLRFVERNSKEFEVYEKKLNFLDYLFISIFVISLLGVTVFSMIISLGIIFSKPISTIFIVLDISFLLAFILAYLIKKKLMYK